MTHTDPEPLADLWHAVELASPTDPFPLLLAADRCVELHDREPENGWDELGFALRWCAGRNRRPVKTKYVRHPWLWICERQRHSAFNKAELKRYESYRNRDGLYIWFTNPPHRTDLNELPQMVLADIFSRLTAKELSSDDGFRYRIYPTREAAFADLRNAIRASGSTAGEE